MDPDGVFLTDYWRAHLGLSDSPPHAAHCVSLQRTTFLPRPEALRFSMSPSDEAFLTTASQRLEFEELVPTDALTVSQFIADLERTNEWMPGFEAVRFHTVEHFGRGSTFDEHFSFMTLRVRVLHDEPGREWLAMMEGCSLPIASRMIERFSFEQAPGGTRVRWLLAFDVPDPLAPFFGLVAPLLKAWVRGGLRNLKRRDWGG